MDSLSRWGWALAAALVLAFAAPAAAAPRWSQPENVAAPGSQGPRVAMDAQGNTIVAWSESDPQGGLVGAYRWSSRGCRCP